MGRALLLSLLSASALAMASALALASASAFALVFALALALALSAFALATASALAFDSTSASAQSLAKSDQTRGLLGALNRRGADMSGSKIPGFARGGPCRVLIHVFFGNNNHRNLNSPIVKSNISKSFIVLRIICKTCFKNVCICVWKGV